MASVDTLSRSGVSFQGNPCGLTPDRRTYPSAETFRHENPLRRESGRTSCLIPMGCSSASSRTAGAGGGSVTT
jgi:hypothetical protein